MKKIIIGFAIGFVFGNICSSFAKNEIISQDAASVVGYGYNGNSLVAIKVDSDGVVQIST